VMVERRQQGQRDRDGVAVLSRSVRVEGFAEQRPAGLGSVFGEEVGDEFGHHVGAHHRAEVVEIGAFEIRGPGQAGGDV